MVVKPKAKANSVTVLLDDRSDKSKSVKYWTEAEGVPFSNIYVKKSALEAMGNPTTLKVTIEPGE